MNDMKVSDLQVCNAAGKQSHQKSIKTVISVFLKQTDNSRVIFHSFVSDIYFCAAPQFGF